MVLDEMSDGPLHAANNAPVNHNWALLRTVRTDVMQVKLLRLMKVNLDGGQSGLPVGAISHLNVDLWAIERGLVLYSLVNQARLFESSGQQCGGPFPHFRGVDVLPAMAGQGEPVANGGDA
ncbi:hypothetical protein NORO109296_01065 [Nocardiopsis rhodophaea]